MPETFDVSKSVGLVACCGEKRPHRAEAQFLYQSPLFSKSRAVAMARCRTWAILSAAHGLVMPDKVLEPYEASLNGMGRNDRRHWAQCVRVQLLASFGHGPFYVLAGEHYRGCVELKVPFVPGRESAPLPFEAPMRGLGIGQQLAWLDAQLRSIEAIKKLEGAGG